MARRLVWSGLLIGQLWVCVCPAIGAETTVEGETAYYYFKERRPLVLDPSRIAVFLDTKEGAPGEAPMLAGEEFALQPASPMPLKGWYFAALKPESSSAQGVRNAVSRVTQTGQARFSSPVFVAADGGPLVITPTILVGFRPIIPGAAAERILAEAGAGTIQDRDWANMRGAYRVKSAARDGFAVLEIANALARRPEVLYAEPDFIITGRGSLIPNDTFFGDAWGIHNTGQSGGTPDADMDGPEAWDITTGDPSIKVLIIDTGVQQNHPDINQLPGADVTSDGPGGGGGPVNACDNHGTAVAGCVSATINNNLGVVGIAPLCKSVSVRFAISSLSCNGTWSGVSSWTVDALAFGELVGVRVTNNSNYYPSLASASIETKYEQTRNNGMVHFASAGNDSLPSTTYPSSLPTVNAIAALERHGNRAGFSNWGADLFASAPGETIISTDRTGGDGYVFGDYVFVNGTSFASPYTAGVAALVLTINSAFPASSVESILASSAVDLGAAGWDTNFGWGFINAHRAIVTAQGGCDAPGPPDCNENGVSDECDLFDGTSQDCNLNTIPDDCESLADCQPNGAADICDIASGLSGDCNGNTIPDECDLLAGSVDCNTNAVPDECDAAAVASLTDGRPAILGFTDISGTGTPLNLADDGSATVTMPFTPNSFPSSLARVSNNGVIGFGNTGDVFNPNEPLPSSMVFNYGAALLAYWDDLDATTGNVYHQTIGTAPNRTFVVQWHDRPLFPGDAVLDGDEGTFQIQIYETPMVGVVAQYLYADTTFGAPNNNGRSATTGYQRDRQVAIQYSHNGINSITPATVLTLIEADCQGNQELDSCELAGGAPDCNSNAVIDECDISRGQDPDCNSNETPDSCDVAAGAPNCDGDLVPDECELDCQPNGTPDDCDILLGTSEDDNGNQIPDECDLPPDLMPEAPPIAKSRFISLRAPVAVAGPGPVTALRINLDSLHHVNPPYTGARASPFTACEGKARWAGPPSVFLESQSVGTRFVASQTQSTPFYRDWSSIMSCSDNVPPFEYGTDFSPVTPLPVCAVDADCPSGETCSVPVDPLLHVTGSSIVSSSRYTAENVASSCIGNEAGCTSVSAGLVVETARWGDVVATFQLPCGPSHPNPLCQDAGTCTGTNCTTQADASDFGSLVSKFRSQLGAPIKARGLLAGTGADGAVDLVPDLGFNHISAAVAAFQGKAYPYTPECMTNP